MDRADICYLKWISSALGISFLSLRITISNLDFLNYHYFHIDRCALLELWSEGTAPFEFSQLLSYRSGDMELVTAHLAQLENDNLRNLISSMISLNPKERKSADVYLDEERGRYTSLLLTVNQLKYFISKSKIWMLKFYSFFIDCFRIISTHFCNPICKCSRPFLFCRLMRK